MMFLAGTFAEVERRVITERTMRGKREAARQGRVPTGFSKFNGPYGPRYDKGARRLQWLSEGHKHSGFRLLSACIAGRSISSITNELNDACIRVGWRLLTSLRRAEHSEERSLVRGPVRLERDSSAGHRSGADRHA